MCRLCRGCSAPEKARLFRLGAEAARHQAELKGTRPPAPARRAGPSSAVQLLPSHALVLAEPRVGATQLLLRGAFPQRAFPQRANLEGARGGGVTTVLEPSQVSTEGPLIRLSLREQPLAERAVAPGGVGWPACVLIFDVTREATLHRALAMLPRAGDVPPPVVALVGARADLASAEECKRVEQLAALKAEAVMSGAPGCTVRVFLTSANCHEKWPPGAVFTWLLEKADEKHRRERLAVREVALASVAQPQ